MSEENKDALAHQRIDDHERLCRIMQEETNKKIDAVCLNIINKENNFGSNTNEIDLISENSIQKIQKDTKLNVSFNILEQLKEQHSE